MSEERTTAESLLLCDACGACVAVCPMRVFYGRADRTLSPRAVIRLLRFGETESAGLCVDCRACEEVCPQGVGLRRHLLETGLLRPAVCACCGAPIKSEVVQARLAELTGVEHVRLLCERCRRRGVARRFERALPRGPETPPRSVRIDG